MEKHIDFETLKEMLLYKKITQWNNDEIILDNGVKVKIKETDQDCCASAGGAFDNVVLNAAITDVTPIEYTPWTDGDTYGCSARVTFLHNRNIICVAAADADAGNGGFYFSVASFVVTSDDGDGSLICKFVESDD